MFEVWVTYASCIIVGRGCLRVVVSSLWGYYLSERFGWTIGGLLRPWFVARDICWCARVWSGLFDCVFSVVFVCSCVFARCVRFSAVSLCAVSVRDCCGFYCHGVVWLCLQIFCLYVCLDALG